MEMGGQLPALFALFVLFEKLVALHTPYQSRMKKFAQTFSRKYDYYSQVQSHTVKQIHLPLKTFK
jgi:hypothetical protein